MGEHYFSADPTVAFRRVPVRATVWGHRLELVSAPGVFARGRLDVGTGVLVREAAPDARASTVLDLGCGYGVLATALALSCPRAAVWAVDVNERALALTEENARTAGVADRVHAALPDAVPADVTFDEIWSNPPIRIGKAQLHALLQHWLTRLTPDGRAVLVVGKNLGADSLHRWLEEQGHATTRLASAKGFRVLETRSRAGTGQRRLPCHGPREGR